MRIRLRTLLGLVLAIALALAFYSSFMHHPPLAAGRRDDRMEPGGDRVAARSAIPGLRVRRPGSRSPVHQAQDSRDLPYARLQWLPWPVRRLAEAGSPGICLLRIVVGGEGVLLLNPPSRIIGGRGVEALALPRGRILCATQSLTSSPAAADDRHDRLVTLQDVLADQERDLPGLLVGEPRPVDDRPFELPERRRPGRHEPAYEQVGRPRLRDSHRPRAQSLWQLEHGRRRIG